MSATSWNSLVVVAVIFLVVVLTAESAEKVRSQSQRKMERSHEHRLKKMLLRHYDKTTRPVRNDRTQVKAILAISLYHILDTNEKEQTFTCLVSVRQRWKDEYLVWNASEYGDVKAIRIPADKIWTPDLVISNFAGNKFNDYMVTNAIVESDGSILWMYPAMIKTYCMLNVMYFPFDTQHCEITFISWTYSGYELDVNNSTQFNNVLYYNPRNQEWDVESIVSKQNIKTYACCPEPYPDVTFTINMRRGSLFYVINLIAPCFLIFLISFLGFFLPVESGDKVNLETTILLALVVFLLMVGETMPPVPDAIPILGMFFALTMVMVTVALVMAVIVTNIYAKKESHDRCPRWAIRLATPFYRSELGLLPKVGKPTAAAANAPTGVVVVAAERRPPPPSSTPQMRSGPIVGNSSPAVAYDVVGGNPSSTGSRRKYTGSSAGSSTMSRTGAISTVCGTMDIPRHPGTAGTTLAVGYPVDTSPDRSASPHECGCFGLLTSSLGELRADSSTAKESRHQSPALVVNRHRYDQDHHRTLDGCHDDLPRPKRRRRQQVSATTSATHSMSCPSSGRQSQSAPSTLRPTAASMQTHMMTSFMEAGIAKFECDSEVEWRVLAKFTDRVFFWIFLALSACTHLALLKMMYYQEELV